MRPILHDAAGLVRKRYDLSARKRLSVSSRTSMYARVGAPGPRTPCGPRAAFAWTIAGGSDDPARHDLRFAAPDDVYEAILSLGDGLERRAAHSALAAFALLLANHIGDDAVVYAAIASG